MTTRPVLGMTLAGGGARGAYAAGVLRYLFRGLPKELGYEPWPALVSGTSVGALNGYFAASHSMLEIVRMTDLWTNMRPNQIFTLPDSGALQFFRSMRHIAKVGSFLSNEPLRNIIVEEAKRRTLRDSIKRHRCRAFIVSATHLTSGMNTLFVETADPTFRLPPPPKGNIIYTKIYPRHLLGTIAIPLVFPPEEIDGKIYVDGGVRQNTPVRPVIHGGADKILVLSTRGQSVDVPVEERSSLSLVAGKTLNALTLDPVERDLEFSNKINRIIEFGIEHYGVDFAVRLREQLNIRQTQIFNLHPSMDLGQLAMEVYRPKKIKASARVKWLFGKLYEQGQSSGESDLLSQFYFDSTFTKAAEDLGFQDTKKQRESIISFLTTQRERSSDPEG